MTETGKARTAVPSKIKKLRFKGRETKTGVQELVARTSPKGPTEH